MAQVFLLVTICLCSVVAEPPVTTYLPAEPGSSSAVGAPSANFAEHGLEAPSTSSVAGPSTGSSAPVSSPRGLYGAPAASFSDVGLTRSELSRIPSSSAGGDGQLSPGEYGAPTTSSIGGGLRPSGLHGTQFSSSGASMRSSSGLYDAPGMGFGIPSNQLGAPGSGFPSALHGAPGGGLIAGGFGQDDYEYVSEPTKYQFKYDVYAPENHVEFGHEEARDGDKTTGAYYVLLPDGRRQLVQYIADLEGYKPKISYQDTDNAFGAGNVGGEYGGAGDYGSGPADGSDAGYRSPGSSGVDGYSSFGAGSQGSGPY